MAAFANTVPVIKNDYLVSGNASLLPDFDRITCGEGFETAAEAAAIYARKAGIKGSIPIELISENGSCKDEGYALKIGENIITVKAGGIKGINRGLAILLQLSYNGSLFEGSLKSSPDCGYRGVMIDLARNWHPFSYLIGYVDMCWLFGIKTLHLHFTDDQSYTLPSEIFPLLSTPGRHYTREELAELDRYAFARGVEIMPEIDVPGHCISFQTNYNEIFGEGGIIVQTEKSMQGISALFRELCEMFPHSDKIHIGGDEAAILKWTENPECRAYAVAQGIDFDSEDKKYVSERMLANFVEKAAEAVKAMGRQAVCWEGFGKCVNDYVSKDILVFSWENFYQVTPDLLEGGFKIINGSWRPMYIVTPAVYWSREEVYDWSIYKWTPVHGGSPYAGTTYENGPDDNIIGGQLLAWGDAIEKSFPTVEEGIREERRLVAERASILSERTWNREKAVETEEFLSISDGIAELLRLISGAWDL